MIGAPKLFTLVVSCLLVAGNVHAAAPEFGEVEERAGLDHEPTAERPFPPSYITTDSGRSLRPEDFESPEVCAGCHPVQYEGWRGSMHSNAFIDPIFQAEWAKAEEAMDGKLLYYCGSCHSPIGTVTQSLYYDEKEKKFKATNEISERGVSCDVCHQMTDTNFLKTHTLEHGNASFNLSPGRIKYGPLKDAESPYHETQYSELHTRADLCANCHNVFHPVNGLPIERTYDEWKRSVYAQHGIVCQDCHMNPVDTAIQVAKQLKKPSELEKPVKRLSGKAGTVADTERKVVHNHEFVGGNAVITAALQPENKDARRHADIARKRLKNAAEIESSMRIREDGLAQLSVDVTNVAAGHHLPTSLTQVRELWIQVEVKDEEGKTLFSSGSLNEHGEIVPGTTIFRSVTADKSGKPTHKPWEMNYFIDDTTIPPKGHRLSRYVFDPSGTEKIVADVRLNYRSASQHFIDKLLGEGTVQVPTVIMEHVVQTYRLGENGDLELVDEIQDPEDAPNQLADKHAGTSQQRPWRGV